MAEDAHVACRCCEWHDLGRVVDERLCLLLEMVKGRVGGFHVWGDGWELASGRLCRSRDVRVRGAQCRGGACRREFLEIGRVDQDE